MSYKYYTIEINNSEITGNEKRKEIFHKLEEALKFAKSNWGYLFREKFYKIYGYKWGIFPCRIMLGELSDKGLLGGFVQDEFGGYYVDK